MTVVAAVLSLTAASVLAFPSAAAADTAQGGSASAFAVEAAPIIPPTPAVESTLADEDASETLVDIPGDPIAVSGTATATAAVHAESDLASQLLVNAQELDGPYNAAAFGEIEGAEVLVDAVAEDVSLIQADVVRAEAVAVCTGDTVAYSANSEIVNLDLAGQDVPLNGPTEELLDTVQTLLEETTLDQVVSVERNVVTESENGIAVDALRVEILPVATDPDPAPIILVLGHAELSDVTCGPDATTPPECSDGEDNDGDGRVDADDPMCHTDGDLTNPDSYDPNDDDEGGDPECVDGVDNADPEDELADAADPGCHTDGDAANPDSYDPLDDSELDSGQARQDPAPAATLPETGAGIPVPVVLALMGAGLIGLGVRRRLATLS